MAVSLLTRIRYRLLPRSLFGRSLMIIAMPILLLQMSVAYVFFDRHWDSMSSKLAFALAGEINMISENLVLAKTDKQRELITRQVSRNLEMLVTFEKGKVVPMAEKSSAFADVYWYSATPILHRMLSQKLNKPFSMQLYEKDRWFEIDVQISENTYAKFLCHDRRLVSATTYIFVLWLIGSALILFAISILFMRNQIRPIMKLAVAAEKLGKGHDVPDFKPIGAIEVRRASRAFLDMKDRLKRQMEQRTAMLAGVSHDLRTPLTRIKLQLAMSKNTAEADSMRQDIDEMEKMIEGYLTFAKGEGNEQSEIIDLAPVLERIVSNSKRLGFNVVDTITPRLMLKVRPMAIERAMSNIVNNACNYAQQVWVSAYVQSNMLEIAVDDNGAGIPAHLRDDVFKPFYRVEKSRNKKTGGVGLGLSIAQDIVHSHGGEIFLEDSNRGGLRVVIRLPL